MTEKEARNVVSIVTKSLLMMGMSTDKLAEHTAKIKEVAKGDPQKTVDGYQALVKRIMKLRRGG